MRRLFFLVAAALAPRAVQAQTLLADPILSTIEQDLAVAQNLLKVLSAEGKAAAIKSAEGKTALRGAQTTLEETFEYAEVNRLRAMRDETILSKTDSRDALTAHDLAFSHGTVFDIDEYPLGVALHCPSAQADDAYNMRIVALATPTDLPPDLFDVSKGHRGACSRRCTSFASCAGFAWKRAVPEECVFFRAPDDVVAVDRAGELVPGGLPLTMNADWNWYAKPTQNSEVRTAGVNTSSWRRLSLWNFLTFTLSLPLAPPPLGRPFFSLPSQHAPRRHGTLRRLHGRRDVSPREEVRSSQSDARAQCIRRVDSQSQRVDRSHGNLED